MSSRPDELWTIDDVAADLKAGKCTAYRLHGDLAMWIASRISEAPGGGEDGRIE